MGENRDAFVPANEIYAVSFYEKHTYWKPASILYGDSVKFYFQVLLYRISLYLREKRTTKYGNLFCKVGKDNKAVVKMQRNRGNADFYRNNRCIKVSSSKSVR